MYWLAVFVTVLIAALHVVIFWMETLAWESKRVRAIFDTDIAFAARSKDLAGNQGVYNLVFALMLAAGLILANLQLLVIVLAGIMVVGLYGAATVSSRILYIQALPAGVGIMSWVLA